MSDNTRLQLRENTEPTQAQQELSTALYQLRARASHSDGALSALRIQEEALMRKESEIEAEAQKLLAEIRDCQRALAIVRESISRLSR